jgi:hypothetical protein
MAQKTSALATKPSYKRPLYLAFLGAGIIAIILVIALPASLVHKHHDSCEDMAACREAPVLVQTGCGLYHTPGFDNNYANHNLMSGGYLRNFSITVPPTYNSNNSQPWPVIIDYHGNSRTPKDQYQNSLVSRTLSNTHHRDISTSVSRTITLVIYHIALPLLALPFQ